MESAHTHHSSAMRAALRLLAPTKLSEHALREKLAKRRYTDEDIEAVITELTHTNVLNDTQAAHSAVTAWLDRKPASRAHLAARLNTLGIADDIATSVLDEHFADRSPLHDAIECVHEHLPYEVHDAPLTLHLWNKHARRAAAKLARVGFDEHTIEQAIIEALGEQPAEHGGEC